MHVVGLILHVVGLKLQVVGLNELISCSNYIKQ